MGIIYLLHFDRPLRHARHYLGYTEGNLDRRLNEHRRGKRGARLMQALSDLGIGFELARTWKGDRNFERRLKNRKCMPDYCPLCEKAL